MKKLMTATESAAAGMRPPFCEVHWSWLCAFGEGKCQAKEAS